MAEPDHRPAWERPTFMGFAGKFSDLNLAGREHWTVVAPSTSFGATAPMMALHVTPAGASQIHHVNALDPGTTGGLEYPTGRDRGRLYPARAL